MCFCWDPGLLLRMTVPLLLQRLCFALERDIYLQAAHPISMHSMARLLSYMHQPRSNISGRAPRSECIESAVLDTAISALPLHPDIPICQAFPAFSPRDDAAAAPRVLLPTRSSVNALPSKHEVIPQCCGRNRRHVSEH
ncbi:hypothetical protein C8Q80DRAFT_118701 [Daedaleopsis nitida]|nr:hypothetical protein C8Q80DRAFT_118701 [Daedaleopsis nitida]